MAINCAQFSGHYGNCQEFPQQICMPHGYRRFQALLFTKCGEFVRLVKNQEIKTNNATHPLPGESHAVKHNQRYSR